MTNCKNCGAPIDIYSDKCPYCETPYEAPGGSETRENVRHERMQSRHSCALMDSVMTPNEYRKTIEICRFDSVFGEIKTLQSVTNAIGSRWDIDDDYEERAAKYMRGEQIAPKWIQEDRI